VPIAATNRTIKPFETQYFYCDIPAGQTSSRATTALLTPVTGLEMAIVQRNILDTNGAVAGQYSLTTNDAAKFLLDAAASGTLYYKIYPPMVLASVAPTTSGLSFILKQSTTNSATTTKLLPGRYFVIIKNINPTATLSYSLNWRQF